jgi:hypothetical protein
MEMGQSGIKWDGMDVSGMEWVEVGWNGFKWDEMDLIAIGKE